MLPSSSAVRHPFQCFSLFILLTATKLAAASTGTVTLNLQRQEELSLIINETLGNRNKTMGERRTQQSPLHTGLSVFDITHCEKDTGNLSQTDYDRIGCCQPDHTRLLYNVKIEKERLIVYTSSIGNVSQYTLPPIHSMTHQKRSSYEMVVAAEYSLGKSANYMADFLFLHTMIHTFSVSITQCFKKVHIGREKGFNTTYRHYRKDLICPLNPKMHYISIRNDAEERSMTIVSKTIIIYISDGKPTGCSSYFNGTLHVIGRGTVNNVYHTSESDIFMCLLLMCLTVSSLV